VIDNVPLPIMVKTAKEGRITIVNKASQQLFGFQREQTIGKTPYDIYSKDRADLIAKMDQECLDGGRPLNFPDHALSTPKGVRMVTSTKVPIPGDDGKTEYLLTLIEDVTERRKAVDELHRTKMFLDTVIDNVPLPIVVKTVKDSRFVLINKAREEMHGRPREWTIGKTLFDMFPKERADIIKAQDAECFVSEQPVIISDHTIPTPKGDRIVVSKKVAIRGQDGSWNIFSPCSTM
jgi:PAS domain S-box-containing protein